MGAQPRYRSVKEDLDLLDSMLNRAASRSDRQRTGMLLYFKRNPEAPLKEAAAFLGVSVRNLQRWWQTYEAHGIAGLISAHLLPAGSPDRSAGGELQSELSISALV